MITLEELYDLWDILSDIPVSEDDCIERPFLCFPVGTNREFIWKWFEKQSQAFIVGDVLQGKRALVRTD